MPDWLVKYVLAPVYGRIPVSAKPFIKKLFFWLLTRIQALFQRRSVCRGDRIEFVDFEVASLEPYEFVGPGPGQILVSGRYSTVSPGTETAVLCGLPGARRDFPYTPGYSMAAEVVSAGRDSVFKPGDRVAGRVNHSSLAVVDAKTVFPIPPGVSWQDASFIELGIIVLQGIRKAKIRPGEKVAVLGQGLIGQMANRLAKLVGAGEVVAIASSRRREASALADGGADSFVAISDGGDIDQIGADVVIEAVGMPNAIVTALRCSRDGGRVVLLGSARGLSRDVDIDTEIQRRCLTVVGAHITAMPDEEVSPGRWTYRQEGRLFLDLLAAGRLKLEPLVTWLATPDQCNAVYEVLAKGGKDQVAVVFDWQGATVAGKPV